MSTPRGAYVTSRCAQELCENWSGDGRVCPCALLDIEGDDRPIGRWDAGHDDADPDPCNYCSHDNTDHRGDGCLHCGCDVPQ